MILTKLNRDNSVPRTLRVKYCLTHWISKLPWELWNPLSKAVHGLFHRSVWHSKCNCLQDWAIFHRSRAWPNCPNFHHCCVIKTFNCILISAILMMFCSYFRTYKHVGHESHHMVRELLTSKYIEHLLINWILLFDLDVFRWCYF